MNSTITNQKNKKFSIVLVNYKTFEITKMCLELLKNGLDFGRASVWVVDNYSADASTEYLRKLDWINLLERTCNEREPGHVAHGRALDMVLDRIETDYLFLLHTDTFVYDTTVFDLMLAECQDSVAAVGCVEQMDRGPFRSTWRLLSRFAKHHIRKIKINLGLKSRDPKPYTEKYLKSFCTLWNAKLIKEQGMHFLMDSRVPGYELQDRMTDLGYDFRFWSPRKIFKYLDHIQAGTVTATGGYHKGHRRAKIYETIIEKNKQN